MLADLAPVPVDAPDTLPAETVRAALVEIIGAGADIEELKKEIERTGITFSMRDGVETMEIPDGNLRGRRTPLSGLYNELSAIFYTMPKGSKLGSLMRASGASGSGAQPSYGLSHTPQKLALTTAIPEAQAAALAPVGNNEIEALAWKQLAQNKAHEIIAADGKRDWYPSQENIADRIAVQFREAVPQVVGGGGKPLTGAYIKRHALRGISSEQGKRRSTIPRRGK